MGASLHVHGNADPYEEKLELRAQEIARQHTKWAWIAVATSVTVAIVGLVIALVKITAQKRKPSKIWDMF